MKLTLFKNSDFLNAVKALFTELNVPMNYIADEPTTAKEILKDTYKENATFSLIADVYFVGMVDDAAFEGNESISTDKIKSDYDGVLVFGITLNQRENNLLPTRSQLAEISRAFNREYNYTPVVLVFKYSDNANEYIAFANTERLKYKQEWREGEKAGKVSLLRDINIEKPHRGHEDIINQLKIPTTGKNQIDSFAKLYNYWQEVFSVNILNKKFYQELSNWYFWAIKQVRFPNEPTKEMALQKKAKLEDLIQEHNATNVIRLLTRLLFTWFIKEKKLIPEELFDLNALQQDILKDISPYHDENSLFKDANKDSIYYKAILQNLFFATLNCPIKADDEDNRTRGFRGLESYGKHRGIDWMMRYKKHFKNPDAFLERVNKIVPFLNGGLFECLDDKTQNLYIDGFSDQMTKGEHLVVPDYLFFGTSENVDLSADYGVKNKKAKQAAVKGLINILKSYKFTITENTPIEEDVALDPELLGKVFENLLASYNPETKTTARKQTGSFYTPREIVNYMVDESLIAYLKNAIKDEQFDEKDLYEKLHQLTSFDNINPFEDYPEISKQIVHALDRAKILDPAAGSGAFPMGILQKMVHILQKLDPTNELWKEVQLEKAMVETKDAYDIDNKKEREQKLIEINNAFDEQVNDPDFARKLYLIENCIYGVDIQPIATQISKLRFFISLVVDQKVQPDKPNFGIRPLPNLETKFVTANTLIGIEKENSLFYTNEIKKLEKELKQIRHKLFNAKTKATKLKYRKKDEELRNKISGVLKNQGLPLDEAQKLASWDPYDQNASSPFFDPEWMFDIKEGFDIVIGNPPYIDSEGMVNNGQEWLREYLSLNYDFTKGNWDIYIAFFEVALRLSTRIGSIVYITPDKWITKPFGKELRINCLKYLHKLLRSGRNVFESVGVDSIVTLFIKKETPNFIFLDMINGQIKPIAIINKNILQHPFQLDITFSQHLSLLIELTSKYNTLSQQLNVLCENACSTSDCYILKDILFDKRDMKDIDDNSYYKVINTGTINQFDSRWGVKRMTYLRDKYLEPVVLKKDFHLTFSNSYGTKVGKPKLIIKGLTLLDATIDFEGSIIPGKSTLIIQSNDIQLLLSLSAIINSKLSLFYIKERYSASSYNTGVNFTKDMINNLPIPPLMQGIKNLINIIVKFLLLSKFQGIDNYIILIQKIIDAIVFNLYFPEHMKERDIDVLEYVERDIESVIQGREFEDLSDTEKEKVIEQLHKIWTDPDNEMVKRIAQFKEKSPDILKVILES